MVFFGRIDIVLGDFLELFSQIPVLRFFWVPFGQRGIIIHNMYFLFTEIDTIFCVFDFATSKKMFSRTPKSTHFRHFFVKN